MPSLSAEDKKRDDNDDAEALYEIGQAVDREVDDQWFLARVQQVYVESRSYQLLYVDDGNVEEEVPHEETRPLPTSLAISENDALRIQQKKRSIPVAPPFPTFSKLFLQSSTKSLIEEEEEKQDGGREGEGGSAIATPRIIVHRPGKVEEEEQDKSCIIINAPEASTLAVGVRGIRGVKGLRRGGEGRGKGKEVDMIGGRGGGGGEEREKEQEEGEGEEKRCCNRGTRGEDSPRWDEKEEEEEEEKIVVVRGGIGRIKALKQRSRSDNGIMQGGRSTSFTQE